VLLMSRAGALELDALIFGGGGAGLWALDELHRAGFRVMLAECHALGQGQTVASQGIIHGGLKYTLKGLLTDSAKSIREMPGLWRRCLAGECEPRLRGTRVLADACYLWRSASLGGRIGLVGARTGLRSVVELVAAEDRPDVLRSCPGEVFRVNEPVIDTVSLVRDLAERHGERLLRFDAAEGLDFETASSGVVDHVRLTDGQSGQHLQLRPRWIVLTAGEGNGRLGERLGLDPMVMQRRPLHMVMVRGALPELFGHCVDGAKTRVTVTCATDRAGRRVWQVGGQVSEEGVQKSPGELIAHARRELGRVLPAWEGSCHEWATYRIDRAEGRTAGGLRPEGPRLLTEGTVITAWPTKLALVPELAAMIRREIGRPFGEGVCERPVCWPRPSIAEPPWERQESWMRID